MKKEIFVLEENLDRFQKAFSRYAKIYTAQRLKFEIVKQEKKTIVLEDFSLARKCYYGYNITIEYEPFVVNNRYFIIASMIREQDITVLEYLDNNYAKQIPRNIFTEPLTCDHCLRKSKRKYGFLVYDNKTKSYIRLGKSCLQSFVPYNVDRIEKLSSYSEELFSSSWGYNGQRQLYTFYQLDAFTYAVLNEFEENGYHTNNGLGKSTKERALKRLQKKDYVEDLEKFLNIKKEISFLSPPDVSYKVKENYTTFLKENYIREDYLNSYIYHTFKIYQKESNLEKEKISKKESVFLGTVGERMDFVDIKHKHTNMFDNQFSYGSVSFLHFFEDNEGNLIVYSGGKYLEDLLGFSDDFDKYFEKQQQDISRDDALEKYLSNKRFSFNAKIKKHNKYNYICQTFISYIKNIKIKDI